MSKVIELLEQIAESTKLMQSAVGRLAFDSMPRQPSPTDGTGRHTLHKEWTNTPSHEAVQATLLKEAKQRGDELRATAEARELRCLDFEKTLTLREEQVTDLQEQVIDQHREIEQLKEQVRANATQSPSIEAQKKIIDDLREQLNVSKSRANRQYHLDQDTIRHYEEMIVEDKQHIKTLKEIITRLQDYIKNEK